MTELSARIAGIGSHLPERILNNDEISAMVDTSDSWIRERTGIRQRHIAGEGVTTCDLAERAARRALEDAGIAAEELDLIVVATTTPDFTFPSVGTMLQARLGATQGAAFDVQAVCTGFVYALSMADNMIARGQAKTALVVGAETMSRILDWTDRSTCVLFGDGAGAMVLQAAEPAGEGTDRSGILGTYLRSDGRFKDLLHVDGGPSSTGTVGHLRMVGNQVFRHAITNIAESMTTIASRCGVTIEEVDWFVPHQANQRILEGVARRLSIPTEKVISTVADHGNTSAASVPLAFDRAVQDGRIKRGDLVLMEALGGGFTWGAALARY
ncbi:MAG: 3-oxoacyl-[acyl-carrier-protein] synthase-3 [Maricaulis maris]|jgi:3-oxoacyl-[acyl-carrier-protein] synthase-3|uniref:Beta-ketoacyl-[acyl-carrier-protein] synthase III n=1 Tax=Maricaulis maris (strain MCS10) TaxID=394221 RepID=Q0APH2_MARMM|nr:MULTISPECIES: beta-ketoacyl-ACP synthase III [Maricaulis]ABI65815.1 3-oxoacyl-[acyl-carrier-protein] synthase III [Maricaulis maris MCS10]MAC88132.1 ketoacyl-ACP synthase III [Maricaulis sp.]